ncbi:MULTISPECIES: hypothetical protein [unclassified Kitasatospora]
MADLTVADRTVVTCPYDDSCAPQPNAPVRRTDPRGVPIPGPDETVGEIRSTPGEGAQVTGRPKTSGRRAASVLGLGAAALVLTGCGGGKGGASGASPTTRTVPAGSPTAATSTPAGQGASATEQPSAGNSTVGGNPSSPASPDLSGGSTPDQLVGGWGYQSDGISAVHYSFSSDGTYELQESIGQSGDRHITYEKGIVQGGQNQITLVPKIKEQRVENAGAQFVDPGPPRTYSWQIGPDVTGVTVLALTDANGATTTFVPA